MRTVHFHEYGEPGDILHMEIAAVPAPGTGSIRVAVPSATHQISPPP